MSFRDLINELRPLRRMGSPEGASELNKLQRRREGFADELSDALLAGALEEFDVPDGNRFCTEDMYCWLSSAHGLSDGQVFAQGLEHAKARVRQCSVNGLARFPKDARRAARSRLKAKSAGTREAAVRLLQRIKDEKSAKDLKEMFAREKSKGVRKALEETLLGFGALKMSASGLPSPKPSAFDGGEASDPDTAKKVIDYVVKRSWCLVRTEEVAAAVGIPVKQAEADLLGVQHRAEKSTERPVRWFRAHHVGWIYHGHYDAWNAIKSPDPRAIDAHVAAEDHRGLDRLLAAAGRKAPTGLGSGGPTLRYRDGTDVSAKARSWILAGVFDRSLTLVRASLEDESCDELALWLSEKKRPRKDLEGLSLLAGPGFINAVAKRFLDREIHRSHLAGWERNRDPVVARWSFRFWRSIAAWSTRPGGAIAISKDQSGSEYWSLDWLEAGFPTGGDPSGSDAQWKRWISECLEQSMLGRRSWSLDEFRQRYIDNPLANAVASFVVFEFGFGGEFLRDAKPFVLHGTEFHTEDGPRSAPKGPVQVRVAHSSDGVGDWPPVKKEAFAQRGRSSSLDFPDAFEAVPGREWTRRLTERWFHNGAPSGQDRHQKVRSDYKYYGSTKVELHHSGYLFDAPVKLERVVCGAFVWRLGQPFDANAWSALSVVLRGALVDDLRALCAPTKAVRSATPVQPEASGAMDPTIELAKSSRSKCRHCREKIEKGGWRLGEPYLVPGSSSGRTAMGWWHLECAAQRNKKVLRRGLELTAAFPDREEWLRRL